MLKNTNYYRPLPFSETRNQRQLFCITPLMPRKKAVF